MTDSQSAFEFAPLEPLGPGNFLSFASNRVARTLLEEHANWPQATLVLTGEPASGKSHLAANWARKNGAAVHQSVVAGSQWISTRTAALVIDPVDAGISDRALFQLIEQSRLGEAGPLLLVSRKAPVHWPVALGDLRSRLGAIGHAHIEAADDDELTALFHEFCRRHGIPRDDRLTTYVLARIDRSRAALYDFVRRLNHTAYERKRRVSIALANEILNV